MTSESQDTRLTSHPKDGTLHRAVSPITALGHLGYIYFWASYWPSNTTSSRGSALSILCWKKSVINYSVLVKNKLSSSRLRFNFQQPMWKFCKSNTVEVRSLHTPQPNTFKHSFSQFLTFNPGKNSLSLGQLGSPLDFKNVKCQNNRENDLFQLLFLSSHSQHCL